MNHYPIGWSKIITHCNWLRIFLILIFMAFEITIHASTYYVATNGLDGNPGTLAQPWLTVQKAFNVMVAGDKTLVGIGFYDEIAQSVRDGTSGSRIILDGQNVASIKSLVAQHQFLVFQNCTITGRTNASSALIYVTTNAQSCVISNNIIDGNYADSVYAIQFAIPSPTPFGNSANDIVIVSNVFLHIYDISALTIFGDRVLIQGNLLKDFRQADFFNIWGRSNRIAANICSNNVSDFTVPNHADFIQTFGNAQYGSQSIIVEDNLVVDLYAGQTCNLETMMINEIRDWTFQNNIFINLEASGTIAIPDVKFYNNTFYLGNQTNKGNAISFAYQTYTAGNPQTPWITNDSVSYASGGRAFNNVFIDCGDYHTNVGWYTMWTNLTNVAADYNYVGKNGYKPVTINPLHQSVGDPGGWDIYSWWEPHGINGGDPKVISTNAHNFHLQPSSPLIDTGTNLSIFFTTDFDGFPRGTLWDMGAYEYISPHVIIRGKARFLGKATIR